ncbi:hypothetical protein [Nocardia sp. NBC_00403]|uniref:hypothetical protein n=1 Tax=Nocardia sp. NBC_00403 TaxID=2975990 RepID=UPI002E1C53A7
MHRSTDTHGSPNAVTGVYLDPLLPWQGTGPGPLVVIAPGTQGQGDQCAPSKLFTSVVHYTPPLDVMASYESANAGLLLSKGIAVAVTDYASLGTGAVHDYMNRLAQGHAVLDALRAATRLPGTAVPEILPGSTSSHVVSGLVGGSEQLDWLVGRFNLLAAPTHCP